MRGPYKKPAGADVLPSWIFLKEDFAQTLNGVLRHWPKDIIIRSASDIALLVSANAPIEASSHD